MVVHLGWASDRKTIIRFSGLLLPLSWHLWDCASTHADGNSPCWARDTLLPPQSYVVIVLNCMLFVGCAWLATVLLEAGAARNALQAFCMAVMAGPWTVVNQSLLAVRWMPAATEVTTHLTFARLVVLLDEMPQPLGLVERSRRLPEPRPATTLRRRNGGRRGGRLCRHGHGPGARDSLRPAHHRDIHIACGHSDSTEPSSFHSISCGGARIIGNLSVHKSYHRVQSNHARGDEGAG